MSCSLRVSGATLTRDRLGQWLKAAQAHSAPRCSFRVEGIMAPKNQIQSIPSKGYPVKPTWLICTPEAEIQPESRYENTTKNTILKSNRHPNPMRSECSGQSNQEVRSMAPTGSDIYSYIRPAISSTSGRLETACLLVVAAGQ